MPRVMAPCVRCGRRVDMRDWRVDGRRYLIVCPDEVKCAEPWSWSQRLGESTLTQVLKRKLAKDPRDTNERI